MGDKLFCGIGREYVFKDGGTKVGVSMTKDDVELLFAHLKNGWVTFDVKRRRNPNGDKTHYCEINEWKPKPEPSDPPPQVSPNETSQETSNDLPF